MKKVFLTLALVVSMAGALGAQSMDQAIGVRFGGGFGYGAELSYQQPLGDANRLELDLGMSRWGFGLSGIYQWVWDLSDLAPGFNWYAGVGAGLGSYNFHYVDDRYRDSELSIGLLGQIGIEYNFEIPLQLSLDYRPGIYFVPSYYSSYDGICLAARYRF